MSLVRKTNTIRESGRVYQYYSRIKQERSKLRKEELRHQDIWTILDTNKERSIRQKTQVGKMRATRESGRESEVGADRSGGVALITTH